MLDVIIISHAKNDELYQTTLDAINSLKKSEDFQIQCIVVESELSITYDDCITIHPKSEFNYNKYLKLGMSFGNNEWVALCNNDLIFHKNWFKEIYDFSLNSKDQIKSFSPWNSFNQWHEHRMPKTQTDCFIGYGIGYELCGWCIVAKRDLFNTIDLSEDVNFWCSDNIYADDLKQHGFSHGLITNSKVDHITSKTLFTLPGNKIEEYTTEQGIIYANRNRDNNQK